MFRRAAHSGGHSATQALFEDPGQRQKLAKWHGERTPMGTSMPWIKVLAGARVREAGASIPVSLALPARSWRFTATGTSTALEEFPRRIAGRGERSVADDPVKRIAGTMPHRERRDEVLGLITSFLTRGSFDDCLIFCIGISGNWTCSVISSLRTTQFIDHDATNSGATDRELSDRESARWRRRLSRLRQRQRAPMALEQADTGERYLAFQLGKEQYAIQLQAAV